MPRSTKDDEQENISSNDSLNIIDILLFDHTYLKDCIHILKDENGDSKEKFKYAKGFLDALKKHSAGEKKALYAPLQEVDEFHFQILESEIEHGIVDAKVRTITNKLTGLRGLNEELEAELKVLAELVLHHLDEEEGELFPKMKKEIDQSILNQMGHQFLILREFSDKDLVSNSELKETMTYMKKLTPIPLAKFKAITHEYFGHH